MKRILIFIFSIALISMGCGSSTSVSPTPVATSIPTLPSLPTNTALPLRCVPASSAQIENIRVGVKGIEQNNDIKSVYAVRSNDYERVWFVAAEITGTGIQPKQVIGLWAISGELEQPGLTYSVNSFALQFSDWGDGTKTDAQLSEFDDGAQEAIFCSLNN